MIIKNKSILIYGGGGFLGTEIISRLYNDTNVITVYSRDESKKVKLLSRFPKVRYILGDVSDIEKINNDKEDWLNYDISINLAALKIIESCQQDPYEAVKTIIQGALNTKRIALIRNIEDNCLISSDKACAPSGNIYGPCKSIAESIYVNNNKFSYRKFSVCRYGNVLRSKNSLLDLLPNIIKSGGSIKLLHEDMTRFTITSDEAVDLVLNSLGLSNCIVIPRLKSYKVKDLFDLYKNKFNFQYEIGEPRVGEKLHELLYSYEESRSIESYEKEGEFNYLLLRPNRTINDPEFVNTEFSSKDHTMSYEELDNYLSKFNYFMS